MIILEDWDQTDMFYGSGVGLLKSNIFIKCSAKVKMLRQINKTYLKVAFIDKKNYHIYKRVINELTRKNIELIQTKEKKGR